MFRFSDHLSVNNAFCLRGLQDLAEIATLLGKSDDAAQFEAEAGRLHEHR